jgi:hypothetical protein
VGRRRIYRDSTRADVILPSLAESERINRFEAKYPRRAARASTLVRAGALSAVSLRSDARSIAHTEIFFCSRCGATI